MNSSPLDRDFEWHGEPPYEANSWLSQFDEDTPSTFPPVNSGGHESPLQVYRTITGSCAAAACVSPADNSHTGWPVNNLSDGGPTHTTLFFIDDPGQDSPVYLDSLAPAIDDSLAGTAPGGYHYNGDINKKKADDAEDADDADDFDDGDLRVLNDQRSKRLRASEPVSNSKRPSISDPSSKDEETETPTGRPRAKKPEKVTSSKHYQPGSPGLPHGSNRLRKTCRKAKRPPPSPLELAETAEEYRAKASHNLVEKQYRVRLNLQFERLLSALPGPQADDGRDGDGCVLSKAEVLIAARQRIKSLEGECDVLKRQCSELLISMRKLRDAAQHRPADGVGKLEDGE